MRIDAHQHFWQYDPQEYPWIQPDWPIRRSFLPPDLQPLLAGVGLDACIAVQARQTLEETRWLLKLADAYPFIAGVVGWVDLRAENVGQPLAELAQHPRLVGVRHVVQDEPDDDFMLRPEFLRGIGRLQSFRLAYDILIYPRQLPAAIELVRRFPGQTFVLDHLAKPRIAEGAREPWAGQMRELAQGPNVFCKISGLVTEARWRSWQPGDFKFYLDAAWAAFGEDRLMVGSDWPVCLNSADYPATLQLAADYLRQFSAQAQAKVWGENAARAYRLNA